MATVSFEQMRAEALEASKFDPFELEMPGKQKPIIIEAVPLNVYLEAFHPGDGDPTIGLGWSFLNKVVPAKDWQRLERELRYAPPAVLAALVGKICDHFNLTFNDAEGPKALEGSDA